MSCYTKERDREFYRAFLQAMRIPHISYEDAIDKAINSPTYRYWISADYLYRECLARERGYNWYPKRLNPRRKALYDELYSQLQRMKQGAFKGYSTYMLSTIVVNQPAPGFFIEHRHAKLIIQKFRNNNAK